MHIQGRRNSGRAEGEVKELRAMETYKNKKVVISYVCFCSSTTFTSKIITGIIENHSEFSWCPNSYNKFEGNASILRRPCAYLHALFTRCLGCNVSL